MIIPTNTLKAGIACALAILAVIIFSNNKALLLCTLLAILMTLYYMTNYHILFFVIAGLSGAIAEIIIMSFSKHSWDYRDTQIFGIPLWLIPLWSIASAGVIGIYEFVNHNT